VSFAGDGSPLEQGGGTKKKGRRTAFERYYVKRERGGIMNGCRSKEKLCKVVDPLLEGREEKKRK